MSDPDLGAVIDGRYRLLEKIGLGGMGAVYRAEHVGMGRVVAVKVLRPELGAHKDALARFEREAQAAAKVAHKNVVAVSDFGVRDDGSLYLVMEYLRGETLGERLDREERIAWPHALALARHVARGLAHAHEHGVIHRDIKPDNIFIVEDEDDPDYAKIVDFGIARSLDGGDANVTRVGLVVGTPAYLSPEQALGGELDGRSDVYSLSIVLYEMLCGRTPFADREPIAMLTAHAVVDPPRFAEVAPDLQLPEHLEAVVRRGLAKTKEDRFASANDLATALDEVRSRSGSWPLAVGTVAFGEPSPTGGHAVAPVATSAMMAVPPGPAPVGMPAWIAATFPWTRDRAKLKQLALWGGGGLLVVGLIAAVSTASNPGAKPAAPPVGAVADVAPAPAPDPQPPPAPAPTAIEILTPGDDAPAIAPDAAYKAAVHDLEKGETCPERKAALAQLRALGDPRALPAIKKARYRMRGGVLGVGDSNTNACLKKDADAAIAALSPAKKPAPKPGPNPSPKSP